MQNLNSADLEYFKQLLEHQLDELLQRAEQAVFTLSKDGEISADPLDQAALDLGRESILRFRERESRLISKIKTALEKIEEGEFGICESCGEDIPVRRLMVRPVTAFCIKCKTKMESWEKVVGL